MAPDVIDLISSSPPPAASIPPPSAQPPTKARSTSLVRQDFTFLSDDAPLDLTGLPDEPAPVKERSPKRRRLSPEASHLNRAILPPVRDATRPNRNVPSDPIEFTSSPNPGSPASHPLSPPLHKPSRNAPSMASRKQNETSCLPTIDSDPFADTPPHAPPQASKKPAATAQEPSSDPFASSPILMRNSLRRPPQASPRPLSTINNNTANRLPSPRRERAFDNISSSAPEACSFRSSPPPSSRRSWDAGPDEVINLDEAGSNSEDELPGIADFDLSRPVRRARSPLRRSRSDVIPNSRVQTAKSTATKVSAAARAREREAKAVLKEAEKEKKRLERQEAKDAKAREKERAAALAEVNKVRTDKKISTPEMIVDLPDGFNPTVQVQVETMLGELGVHHTTIPNPVPNVVRWRRKVRSQFNEDMGYWEPTALRVEDEKHALVTVTAEEFVGMALAGGVDAHVASMRQHFAGHHIIYLMEGMTPWLRKNRNIRNRQFASGVRAQDSSAAPSAPSRRQRAAPVQEYVSEDVVEDALLELQVVHDVLIHHTTVPLETAQWITIFTQHISTIPYKARRDQATLGAGFCMESGQVRTGDDAGDTYVRMLQEIARVTAPIAYGIAAEFGSVSKLVNGLQADGPLRLESVRKSANKDGAFSDRTIGQAVSRRLHKVFTGRDEASTDV
ncbi:crossover junction endonuclease eme1 [Paramyrothecium foliicola]|nr:crossover junction endonuclease eme1 [Paramyrothecium foliicola]